MLKCKACPSLSLGYRIDRLNKCHVYCCYCGWEVIADTLTLALEKCNYVFKRRKNKRSA